MRMREGDEVAVTPPRPPDPSAVRARRDISPRVDALDQPGLAVCRPGDICFLHGRAFLGRFSLRLCLGW